jgi:ferric-dicitrate binding protein FerR (iron transport regulator)
MDITLLEKFIKQECTAAEAEQVKAWLAEHPDAVEQYMAQTWQEDVTHPMPAAMEQSILAKMPSTRTAKTRRLTAWLSAAAAVLIIATGSWFFLRPASVSPSLITLQTSHHAQQFMLPDKSTIWLKKFTRLQYDGALFGKANRAVTLLEGEAFFDVQQDVEHPFLVNSKGVETKVLGTSFSVLMEGDIIITVATGKVGIRFQGNELGALTPGKQMLVHESGAVERKDQPEWLAGIWKESSLQLSDAPYDDLGLALEQFYGIHLETASSKVRAQRYNIQLKRETPVEEVIQVLSLLNGITYEKKDAITYIIK